MDEDWILINNKLITQRERWKSVILLGILAYYKFIPQKPNDNLWAADQRPNAFQFIQNSFSWIVLNEVTSLTGLQ